MGGVGGTVTLSLDLRPENWSKTKTGEILSPKRKPTTVLSGHDVKMPSEYLCLYPWVNAALSLGWEEWTVVSTETGKVSAEEHHRRETERNIQRMEKSAGNADFWT